MRFRVIPLMATAVAMVAACSAKSTAPAATSTNNGSGGGTGGTGALTVVSSGASNGTLPTTYTCDGGSQSPPLAWSGAPSGTTGYAMIMTTIPSPGTVKYNWILYNIPATATSIAAGATGVGTAGFADDGGGLAYAPPCSQGPGLKSYIFTVYALSGTPNLAGLSATQDGSGPDRGARPGHPRLGDAHTGRDPHAGDDQLRIDPHLARELCRDQ